ncbi:MAG: radical SAM protein [Deltaproteobacteria bacterium]
MTADELLLRERQILQRSLKGNVKTCCSGNKVRSGELSPGCRRCTAGSWTCLFITGICSERCFFCPAEQRSDHVPSDMRQIPFPDPDGFARFLKMTGREGVAFSGGECLLVFERLLSYIRAVRRKLPGIHIWIYTNGRHLVKGHLPELRSAGLNEIRFNVFADGYSLEKPVLAVPFIKTVTIEIPAVPGDTTKVREMARSAGRNGVKYLNLHQLLMTPYNSKEFKARGYSVIPGTNAVLESEVAALRIISGLRFKGHAVPVQYCSVRYKELFHARTLRSQALSFLPFTRLEATAQGFLRDVSGSTREVRYFEPKLVSGKKRGRMSAGKDLSACLTSVLARKLDARTAGAVRPCFAGRRSWDKARTDLFASADGCSRSSLVGGLRRISELEQMEEFPKGPFLKERV